MKLVKTLSRFQTGKTGQDFMHDVPVELLGLLACDVSGDSPTKKETEFMKNRLTCGEAQEEDD